MSFLSLIPLLLSLGASSTLAQVTATFPNGVTNPEKPEFYPVGSYVNQTSFSRLLSLNGVDDFCIFGPPEKGQGDESAIGNVEAIAVAYCTKPRNGARLIPDGTITAAHFIKTPLYVQIYGFYDGTKINIPYGDFGGELDPHGAENLGNPIGGNVTSNVGGTDVFYEEWMSFISYDQFCMRICTAETGNVTAALQCEHELDLMGCAFVMAIDNFYQQNNSFTSCDGDAAAPPGLYPQANGSTSTFRQRYTGTWTVPAETRGGTFTVGQTVTPSAPYSYPATSNCVTYSTISNGVDTSLFAVTATPSTLTGGSTVAAGSIGSTSQSAPSAAATSASNSTSASASRSGSSSTSASASASASRATSAAASGASGASGAAGNAAASATSGAASAANKVAGLGGVGYTYGLAGVVGLVLGAATLL